VLLALRTSHSQLGVPQYLNNKYCDYVKSCTLLGFRRRAGFVLRSFWYSEVISLGTRLRSLSCSGVSRSFPEKASCIKHPKPQESTLHGGPSAIASMSPRANSAGLYASPTKLPHLQPVFTLFLRSLEGSSLLVLSGVPPAIAQTSYQTVFKDTLTVAADLGRAVDSSCACICK
jgi:hypothetical protein